jgi:hypothetical protein
MPRLRATPEERKAQAAEQRAASEVHEKHMNGAGQEISPQISEAITYWSLEFKRRDVGDDARDIYRRAADDLGKLLMIVPTVHPELDSEAARNAVDMALKAMADAIGVGPDEEIIEHPEDQGEEAGDDEGKPKPADILVSQAKQAKLFHTPAPDCEEYADITIGGRRETHRIRSRGFRQWLRHQYYLRTKSGCSSEALQVAVETIAAHAQFEGEEQEVFCRVAELSGTIYIDLGDETWRAVEVAATGWKVVDEPPVRFRRSPSTKPLPIPQSGDIELLRPFCNVKGDEFILIVAYALAALRPNSNYPVLGVTGEHGACKSSLVATVARFIDPRMPAQRSLPRGEDDLIVAAKGAHLLAYDNISGLPDWLSDAICRLATGGGAGKRKLYSDDDEVLFAGRRPVIVNGIEDIVTRADLVDRAVLLMLEPIAESKRREEKEIDIDLEAKAPKIFGALLGGLVAGLRNLAKIDMPDKPRMADFALWGEACTRAYWPAGTFLKAYQNAIAGSVDLVIENSPVGSAVRALMSRQSKWEGSATELLKALSALIGEPANKEKTWPKQPNALSGKLRRAAPPLRKIGIHIDFGREGHGSTKVITIRARGQPQGDSETSPASPASSANGKNPNEIKETSTINAGDPQTMAGDPPTTPTETIVGTKPLRNSDAGDADDADDLLQPSSGAVCALVMPALRPEAMCRPCRSQTAMPKSGCTATA